MSADIDTKSLRDLLSRATAGDWRSQTFMVVAADKSRIAHTGGTRYSLAGQPLPHEAEANAALIAAAKNSMAALLDAAEENARLRQALRWFLEDDRFDVTVGGNPIAVDEMIKRARAALKEPSNA